jgi:nicotinate dehydrogenase subunit B
VTTAEKGKVFALSIVGHPRWVSADEPPEAAGEPAVLLTIDSDGNVAVYSGKVEYGQAIRHGFALAVSDELGIPPSSVDVVLADTARVPWDRGTVGSASTRTTGVQIQRAAITARLALVELAAAHFGIDAEYVDLSNGRALNPVTEDSVSFGDLLHGTTVTREIPDSIPPINPSPLTGNAHRGVRIDAVEKVTGRAKYAQDLSLPGMLHGRVVRPPTYGAKLTAIDAGRAERVPGFVALIREGDFAGVVAESESAADYARESVRVRWDEKRDDSSDWSMPSLLKDNAGESAVLQEAGKLSEGFAAADSVIEGSYYAPYVANSQMEPSAAVALWEDDSLTIWCASRGPFAERTQLAAALGVDESRIRVISQTVGGSFGTKTPSVSLEAALLARKAGKPVKVTYTREEEFQWSTVRPAALIEIKAGVTAEGKLTAWEYNAYHSGENAFRGRRGAPTPYDVPNNHVAVAGSVSPLQSGSYRSLGGAVNHFARETHMDRIAHQIEIDPLEFRLQNLSHPRYVRVLKEAARHFGWATRQKRDGVGYGIAVGWDAGSYVAQCVEVSVVDRQVSVTRVSVAFDCGAVINPDGVRNQVEGSIIMGMGTALWELVEFDAGRVLTTGFDRYRVPRLSDTPEIGVVIIDDNSNPSTGAGEPGIVPIAAAIANAVADATGVAVEQLPMEMHLR